MPSKILSQRPEFAALQQHWQGISDIHMRDLFAQDPLRFDRFHVKQDGILLDFSKHRATDDTLKLLLAMAEVCDVAGGRDKMFAGAPINTTEKRPALHVALRGSLDKTLTIDNENVSQFVDATLEKMKKFSDKVRAEKKITDIVNVGIGGSDLGTRTVYEALAPFADGPKVHFLPNIDGAALELLLESLNLETTLFAIVSKSFTTFETKMNTETIHKAGGKHFIAITENTKEAEKAGIASDDIFPLRKWIGGRTSIWGAVGLPVAIAIGFENFQKFLDGARFMDTHFRTAPPEKNMPVIMALLGVWYRNFFAFPAQAVIAYSQGLRTFHAYLQQLDMESNGKRVSVNGTALDYATGPVIFGEPGTNAQHAFFQALHQGTDIVPCDFIITARAVCGAPEHQRALNANALAQSKGLMEGYANTAEPHREYPGNRPSSTIILDELDPYHLGMLLALYEHKVFTQGLIWNINSFDQWGVELGKNLAAGIGQALENKTETGASDASTQGLLRYLAARV